MPPTLVRRRPLRGYTLLEVLVVVVVLGIAGALVIPSMGQTGVLRVQAAVRSVVADITFAQADAVAYQDRRAVVFVPAELVPAPTGGMRPREGTNTYGVYDVNGPTLSQSDLLYDVSRATGRMESNLNEARFAGAFIRAAVFDGNSTLVFDELGGPVQDLTGSAPSSGGRIRIEGSGSIFEIIIEAYTGRVSVNQITSP